MQIGGFSKKSHFWFVLLFGLTFHNNVIKAQTVAVRPTPHVPLLNRDPCQEPKTYYCTELTDIKIGKYLLNIPHNMIGQWPPGNDFIELLPRWPGLKGAIKDEVSNSNVKRFDIVHIMIHTIRSEKPTEEGIRYYTQRDCLIPTTNPALGLIEYHNPKTNYLKIKDFVEIYTPINKHEILPKNQALMIKRNFIPDSHIALPNPTPSDDIGTYMCEYGYTIRENLYITVRFHDKHIKDWKAIVMSVNNSVESFIKE
jgi:hypothetical protein